MTKSMENLSSKLPNKQRAVINMYLQCDNCGQEVLVGAPCPCGCKVVKIAYRDSRNPFTFDKRRAEKK